MRKYSKKVNCIHSFACYQHNEILIIFLCFYFVSIYSYALSDGSEAQAQGQLKNVGTDEEAIVVKGSYSFVADDGQQYTVNYVADENGFQPQGAHLPVAPVV